MKVDTSSNQNVTNQQLSNEPVVNPPGPDDGVVTSDAVVPEQVDTGSQYEKDGLQPEDLDSRWTRWRCGVCNYTYEGSKPLKKCPKCGNEDEEKFLDVD